MIWTVNDSNRADRLIYCDVALMRVTTEEENIEPGLVAMPPYEHDNRCQQ